MLNNPMYFYDDQILNELTAIPQFTSEEKPHNFGSGYGDELYLQMNHLNSAQRMPIKDHLYSSNEQKDSNYDRKQQISSRDYQRLSLERVRNNRRYAKKNQQKAVPVVENNLLD